MLRLLEEFMMVAGKFATNTIESPQAQFISSNRTSGNGNASSTLPANLSSKGTKVYLIGSATAQCGLLADFIERNTGLKCGLIEDLETACQSINQNGERILLMRDCYRRNKEMILADLQLVYIEKLSWTLCCLYNLEEDSGVELEALGYGVKGFFYEHEQLENMIKGILGVLKGEIWLKRKTMSEYIQKIGTPAKCAKNSNSAESQLTRREIEILSMLAGGNSNQNIAKTLFISHHTVKTHVYNIYKKIDVSDRMQAALWAVKNL
jgi:DNA-binding CsgD family transcriptional regulator